MYKKTATVLVYTMGLLLLLSSTGCHVAFGPTLGMLSYPIPVSPYMQKTFEDRFHNWDRYSKMPILGPITPNTPTTPLDTPSEDEVMRALEEARPIQGGLPMMHEIQRTNVRIVVEPIAADGVPFGYIDPPRRLSTGWTGATAPCPLQVHSLLHGSDAGWLADPVYDYR